MADSSWERLILAASREDEAGWRELMARVKPTLLAHGMRILWSREDSEDALQEVLVKISQALRNERDLAQQNSYVPNWGKFSFKYLVRMMTNQCVDHLRRRNTKRRGDGATHDAFDETDVAVERASVGQQGATPLILSEPTLAGYFKPLTNRERAIVSLWLQGRTDAEICHELDISSEPTLHVISHRMEAKMRKAMGLPPVPRRGAMKEGQI